MNYQTKKSIKRKVASIREPIKIFLLGIGEVLWIVCGTVLWIFILLLIIKLIKWLRSMA